MTAEIKRPEDRMTVKVNDKDQHIFFSFLRLNSILRIVGSPENMGAVLVDPDTGELILKILLAPTTGPEAFDFELKEDTVSTDDADALLCWTQEHLTYFFVKRFQFVKKHQDDLGPLTEALQSQLNGSGASTSNDQSAGPSA